jgi:hypothetical protein
VTARTGRRAGRAQRTAGVLIVALVGLGVLSSCSTNLTPGVAATIDDATISQNHVDSVVTAACAYTAANSSAQTPTPISLANLRSAITGALVQFSVIDSAARAMKLTASPAAIENIASQSQIPPGLNAADKKALEGFFYDVGKSTAQTQLIGAHLADPSVTDSAQVKGDNSKQATKYLTSYVRTRDIRVNPAYGRWNGSAVVGGSGSLSAPVSTLAKDSETAASNSQANTSALPSVQVC